MERFDVIIIGSGIGGLLTGAALAKDKKKVLILEKAPIIGGRYTEIPYKGYLVTTHSTNSRWCLRNSIKLRIGLNLIFYSALLMRMFAKLLRKVTFCLTIISLKKPKLLKIL